LFGHLLAERRKTFFSDLLSCPEIVDTELVQSHFVGRAIEVGIPLAKLLGVPVVVTAHSPVADFETEQLAYVQEHANAVVVPSDAERQHWIERTGSDRKLFRVWNGAPPAVAVSPMVVESASPIRLLSVSRLSPEKRVEDLVAAMACLRDMGCTCEMDVFGDGPLRAKIEALILEHGLCDSMRLRGAAPHTEVMAHLSASHALVHAADSETFGLVLIEAMSAQVPVVAARSSGAADVVVDGETGFLVPCRDPAALAQRVASLAADPGLRRRLGLAGRQRFEREFSLTAHMKNIERVWAHVLS
jgi:glycosyltransferase involved in cell wall biosynthesis